MAILTMALVLIVCSVWNFASSHSLVIVTANVPADPGQRVDIEIIDGSERGNVYLSKRVSALPPF